MRIHPPGSFLGVIALAALLAAPSVDTNDARRNEELVRRTGSKEAAIRKLMDDANAYHRRGYFELASRRLDRARLLQNEK